MIKSNVVYRTQKRKAAIWILSKICVAPKLVVTGIIENGIRSEVNQKNYDWFNLKDLKGISTYSIDLLRDACDLLFIKNHIDLLENNNDRFDIKIKASREGEVALNEDLYQDDIENYNSEKRFRNLRWQLPLLMVILTVFNIGYSIINDRQNNSNYYKLEKRVDIIHLELQRMQFEKEDTLKSLNAPQFDSKDSSTIK